MSFDLFPRELRPVKQWVLWRRDGARKIPVNPFTFGNAGVDWRNTWGSFTDVMKALTVHPARAQGIGFMLTTLDPYTVIDLDNCFEYGSLTPFAHHIVELLHSYTEYSPSGKGLHIWLKGKSENYKRRGIEIYNYQRWMTITGRPYEGLDLAKIPERAQELATLLTQLPEPKGQPRSYAKRESIHLPPSDDRDLWNRLFKSRNGYIYQALYNGDISPCYNDHSRAVIFLANQLAVITDFDERRVKRMLYQTGLVNEKWEESRKGQSWIDGRIKDAIAYMSSRVPRN